MIIEVGAALVYGNLLEWLIHKYVLHELGKNKSSPVSFHWHRHHRMARQNGFYDRDYVEKTKWDTTGKEIAGLILLALLHIPVVLLSPALYAGLVLHAVLYYVLHSKSHKDPEWAKKWLPWHWDHHMGKNQNANWCVTFPLWDYVLGTRIKYLKRNKNAR